MLASEPYVHLIGLDFSKAFDVARHSTLFSKLAHLPLPDNIYAWLLDFFHQRSHVTRFNAVISSSRDINASVVQGSVLGPLLFIINSSELHCISAGNTFIKDDISMVVPASNSSAIPAEMELTHTCLVLS